MQIFLEMWEIMYRAAQLIHNLVGTLYWQIRDFYIYILSDEILVLHLLVRKPSYSGHFATVTGTNTIGRILSPILQSKDLLFPSYTFILYVRVDRKCSVSFYFDPI